MTTAVVVHNPRKCTRGLQESPLLDCFSARAVRWTPCIPNGRDSNCQQMSWPVFAESKHAIMHLNKRTSEIPTKKYRWGRPVQCVLLAHRQQQGVAARVENISRNPRVNELGGNCWRRNIKTSNTRRAQMHCNTGLNLEVKDNVCLCWDYCMV